MVAQFILSQTDTVAPIDRLHGIRDRFAAGGSIADFVLALTGLLVAFAILYGLMRWKMQRSKGVIYSPRKMFDKSLRAVSIRVDQRDMLRRIARDLRLDHPTVLLLSPQLLTLYGNQWMSATKSVSETQRQQLDDLSATLFPQA